MLVIKTAVLPAARAAGGRRTLVENLRAGPGVVNHPVGVIPSQNVIIPQGWPLEADGTIGCATCHRELPSFAGGSDPFLRSASGSSADRSGFCNNCHSNHNVKEAAAVHWMGVRAAHIRPETDGDLSGGGRLDAASRRCLSCHDGVTASDAANAAHSSASRGMFSDMGRNHPVGVRYPYARHSSNESAYRHPHSLPSSVRLPGGMVSCVSCHNLYAQGDALLSVTTDGSALCFTCHAMD